MLVTADRPESHFSEGSIDLLAPGARLGSGRTIGWNGDTDPVHLP